MTWLQRDKSYAVSSYKPLIGQGGATRGREQRKYSSINIPTVNSYVQVIMNDVLELKLKEVYCRLAFIISSSLS